MCVYETLPIVNIICTLCKSYSSVSIWRVFMLLRKIGKCKKGKKPINRSLLAGDNAKH